MTTADNAEKREQSLYRPFRRVSCTVMMCAAAGMLFLSGCASSGNSGNGDPAGWEAIPDSDFSDSAQNHAGNGMTDAGNVSAVAAEDTGDDAAETSDSVDTTESEESLAASMSALQLDLGRKISGLSGTWAVYVRDVDSGKTISLNNQAMVSASLIKLYIAGAYFDAVSNGTIEDTYGDTLDIMLNRNDNDAANTLIDLLGYDVINSFIQDLAFSDDATVLNRKMPEQSQNENYTSVRDCGLVLEKILNGTYVNAEASERILSDLKVQERTSKIPAGVPEGVETANKTGELSDVENDAAIIWGPDRTYLLVVMSNDVPDTAAARNAIVEISQMVYDAIG